MTIIPILENCVTGVKLLLKENPENLDEANKKNGLGLLTTWTEDCWSTKTTMLLQWDGCMHLHNYNIIALLISWIVLREKLCVYFKKKHFLIHLASYFSFLPLRELQSSLATQDKNTVFCFLVFAPFLVTKEWKPNNTIFFSMFSKNKWKHPSF